EPARDATMHQRIIDRVCALRAMRYGEVPARFECLDEQPALRGAVLVEHGDLEVANVPADRVPEEHQHHHRHAEREHHAARIATELNPFLACYRERAPE